LDTAEIIAEFQRTHGISDADMLDALVTYIGNQDSNDALTDFLAENFD
jgi:hypothetical protein